MWGEVLDYEGGGGTTDMWLGLLDVARYETGRIKQLSDSQRMAFSTPDKGDLPLEDKDGSHAKKVPHVHPPPPPPC